MTAIETGCPYSFAVGSRVATMNNPADGNFVGYIDDVTGLDMYGIRENAGVLAGSDGGWQGVNFKDRRPFTVSGFIMPTTPVSARDAAQDKLTGVLGAALDADGSMTWTPLSDSIQRGLYFRTQQPLRFTKGQANVQKRFQVAGAARDWRVIKWAQSTASATLGAGTMPLNLSVSNGGNADAAPIFTITGPITNPVIYNTTTGKKLTFSGAIPAVGTPPTGTFSVDLFTNPYPYANNSGSDWYSYADPLNSDWTIALAPGTNAFQLQGTGTSSATALQIAWHDSWH